MGTITPYGKISYKPTDYQNIKFKLKPEYEFLGWNFRYEEIQSGEKYTREITNKNWWKDYIEIVNDEVSEPSTTGEITYTLQIKFIKAEENMLIEPICGKKPLVTEWKPTDDRAGVSCQTPIYITFDSEILKDSLKDSITILVDGSDYTDYFTAPDIETVDSGSKQYSRISLTPKEVLPCPDDESKTAVVTIKLTDAIKTTQGVSLTPVQYTYRINSKPLSYSYVDMSDYNVQEGQTIPNTSPLQFAIAKYIPLSFKENNGYQFLYWTTNNDNIKFAEDDVTLNPTSFYTMTLINETEKAKISPVCAPRPKLKESDFNNKYSGHLNPRDSDIILTFDKNIVIPEDAKFAINCTGKGDVSSAFEEPVAVDNIIQIISKKDSNRIQVRNGESLTITVTIPESLYYVYHDAKTNQDINVTIGKNAQEVQPEYKIDDSTQDTANVTFSSMLNENNTGSISIDNAKNDDKVHEYDIDKEVIINFRPNEDYEFLYWTTSNSNITIKDRLSASTTLTVSGSGNCTVTAKCVPKLKVIGLRPNASDNKNPCDSDIWIQTNIKPLDITDSGRTTSNKKCNSVLSISVNYNGTDVMSTNYEKPVVVEGSGIDAGKHFIYLKSKKKLAAQEAISNVNVKIDGTFHYEYVDSEGFLPDPVEINLVNGNYSGSFGIVETTQKQIYVKLNVNASHMDFSTAPFESYKDGSVYKLNEKTEYDLTFTPKTDWQFVNWIIKDQNNTDLTSVSDSPVKIEKTTIYGINYYKFIVSNAKDGVGTSSNPILLSDDSAQRLALNSVSPNNISAGVERDSSIELTFNKKPDDSIKQKIQITIDGYSVADSFNLNAATFAGNKLTISPNLSNRISVSAGTTRKVKVTIPADSYYTYPENAAAGTPTTNITCGQDYTYEYTINETTNDKVKVTYQISKGDDEQTSAGTIKCNDVVVPETQVTYNMDSITRTLTFTEKPDYQFLYWETNKPQAFIFTSSDLTSKTIQFTINKTENMVTDDVTVTAYCAPRLKITSVEPAKNTQIGVQRDSEVSITFNKKPELEIIKDSIRIICDGISVNSNFLMDQIAESSFENTTLTIKSNPNNRITVPSDAKKTVLVTVDSATYYKYSAPDGNQYDITLGKDYTHEYIINSHTKQQAKVLFKVYDFDGTTELSTNTAGKITCEGAIPSSGGVTYDMDKTSRTLNFTESEDYQFLYWLSTSSIVSINANTYENKTTTFTPSGTETASQIEEVTIKAVCAKRPRVSGFEPSYKEEGVVQDSDIKIKFDRNPVNYSAIKVSRNDVQDTSHFTVRNISSESSNTLLTITTSKVNTSSSRFVTSGSQNVKVEIPSGLYYTCTSNGKDYNVTYGGSGRTDIYKINSGTFNKVKITAGTPLVSDTENSAAGTVSLEPAYSDNKYSIGEKVIATLSLNDGYMFTNWGVSGTTEVVNLSNAKSLSATLTVQKSNTGTFTVTPTTYQRPVISTTSVTPYNSDATKQYSKNTPITLTFAHAIKPETKDNIVVNYTGSSTFEKTTYYTTTISSDNKTVTLTPKKMLPVNNDFEIVTVTVPHDKVYYFASDNVTKITPADEDFTWSFRVNYSTLTSTKVKMETSASSSGTTGIKVDGILQSSGTTNTVNVEQKLSLEYPLSTGYKFAGWKIPSTASGYTISSAGFVTSGTVTIKKGTKTYFALAIDSTNPAKATITSYDAIDNGTDGFGFTITSKDYLQPLATITPDYISSGVDCDTPVTISFNKAVNIVNGTSDLILGTNGIIKIVNDINKNQHYEDYFNSPEWSTDRKTLTITPKYSIRDIFSSQADLKDILIKIDYSQIEDDEGYSLDIAENIDWLYRIKYVKDDAPPSIKKLFIARTQADALAGTNLITVDEFEHYATKANYDDDSSAVLANIRNHHIKDKVWIYYEIEDIQSGMSSLELEEKIVRTVSAQTTIGTVYDKNSNPDTHYFASPANSKLISGTIEYSFNEVQDGVVRLSFIAKDKNGNPNIQNVDFIKDTIITVSPIVRFGNVEKSSNDFLITEDADSYTYKFTFLGQYGKALSITTATTFIKDMDGVEYKECFYSEDRNDLSYTCRMLGFEWWYDGGEKHYIDLQSIQGSVTNYRNSYQSIIGYAYQIPVSIDINPKKNINYTCTYCDVVGNTATSAIQTVLAPKEIKGVNISEEGFSLLFSERLPTNNGRLCYYIYENEQGVRTELIRLENKDGNVWASNFSGLESKILNVSATIGNSNDPRHATTVRDVSYPPITTIGNGTYYLYLFEQMSSNGGGTYLAGKPFVLYKNDSGFTTNVTSVTLTSSDIPTFTPTFTKAERNSGLLNVHIDWQQGFSFNDDYTYYITDGTDYYSGDDFSIKYSSSVKLKVVVYDINTQKIEGSQKTYNISTQYDTIQPTYTNSDPVIFQNCARIHVNLDDPDSGLKKVNNKVIVKALLSDTQGLENLIDWDNYPGIIEAEYHPKVNSVQPGYFTVPIYGICPKYVYYYIEDVAGNYKVGYKSITEPVNLNTVLQISGENNADGGNIYLSMEGEPMGGSYAISLYPYYLENNTWKDFTFPNTSWVRMEIKTDGTQFALPVKGMRYTIVAYDLTNHFVKIDPAHYYTAYSESVANRRYAQDSYFYVPYLLAKDTANPIVCNIKDIVVGQVGVSVLADNPYFIHTLYCPRNLGSNLDDWLNIGMETGLMQIVREKETHSFTVLNDPTNPESGVHTEVIEIQPDYSYTYSYDNAAEVPSGYYYTVIVHFADGTTVMSDVRQK